MRYDYIDQLLKEKHMSRRRLAVEAGIPENTMGTMFKRKQKIISKEVAQKIASVLGVGWATLYDTDLTEWISGLHLVDVSEANKDLPSGVRMVVPKNEYKVTFEETILFMKHYLSMLNEAGQTEAVKRVEELTMIPKYRKDDSE